MEPLEHFPLSEFILVLQSQGFLRTVNDFMRIAGAFKGGRTWTLDRVRHTLRAIVCHDKEDLTRFDKCFSLYFCNEVLDTDHIITALNKLGRDQVLNDVCCLLTTPVIHSICPQIGPVEGGTTVILEGDNFVTQSTDVLIGENPVHNLKVVDSKTLCFHTPKNTDSAKNLIVKTPVGSVCKENAFTYYDRPAITSVIPDWGSTVGGTIITITGHNFLKSNTTVRIGSREATCVHVMDSRRLTCVAPNNTAGKKNIEIGTPYGLAKKQQGFRYKNRRFVYAGLCAFAVILLVVLILYLNFVNSAPVIRSIAPLYGPTKGGTLVTIKGEHFVPDNTRVFFGGQKAKNINVFTPQKLNLIAPENSLGAKEIRVMTPHGTEIRTDAYIYVASPIIENIVASSSSLNGNISIEISGENFIRDATSVTIAGESAMDVTVQNSNFLTCAIRGYTPGNVVVTTIFGSSDAQKFSTQKPLICSVFPNSGPIEGGTSVTILGANFGFGTKVKIGEEILEVKIQDPTRLTITTPAGETGNSSILIYNDFGKATATFTYIGGIPPPLQMKIWEATVIPVYYRWKQLLFVVLWLVLIPVYLGIKKRQKDKALSKFRGPYIFRHNFSRRPLLSASQLDELAVGLGHYRHGEDDGKTMDVAKTIEATCRNGGIFSMVTYKEQVVPKKCIILTDYYLDREQWNTLPDELVEGLRNRGIEVISGYFQSFPRRFFSNEGEIIDLQELTESNQQYFLIVFGRSSNIPRNSAPLFLERLKLSPFATWLEMEDEHLWDESTKYISQFIPVLPCTPQGITKLAKLYEDESFITSKIKAGRSIWDYWVWKKNYRKLLFSSEERHLAYIGTFVFPRMPVDLLSDIQQRFYPQIEPGFIKRLQNFPGVSLVDEGLEFDPEVRKDLTTLVRNETIPAAKHKEICRHILQQLKTDFPENSVASALHQYTLSLVKLHSWDSEEITKGIQTYKDLKNNPLMGEFIRTQPPIGFAMPTSIPKTIQKALKKIEKPYPKITPLIAGIFLVFCLHLMFGMYTLIKSLTPTSSINLKNLTPPQIYIFGKTPLRPNKIYPSR